MQIVFSKTNEKNLRGKGAIPLVFALLTVFAATSAWGAVSGPCNLCHTMHNSQDGTVQVSVIGAAWDTGVITGGSSTVPPGQLLVSDCVGCHSSVGNADIIVNDGYNNIPIVYNTGGYPAITLAGGNFAVVAGIGMDDYGHNVRGISLDDPMAKAPGFQTGVGCNNSCHTDLTLTDAASTETPGGYDFNGCRGCHINTSHHDPNNTSYRFLSGHGGVVQDVGGGEAADWEATVATGGPHNIYLYDQPGDGVEFAPSSMGRWCAGCHNDFHAWGTVDPQFGDLNAGDTLAQAGGNPWLRHPTNVTLPSDGEYGNIPLPYNANIPVAQRFPFGNPDFIDLGGATGDQVFCLSCHRAHASDQPDALRFDYNAIESHQGTATKDPDGDGFANGCFYCHTSKANL